MSQPVKLNVNQANALAMSLSNIGFCDYVLPPSPKLNFSNSWAKILGYQPDEIPKPEIFQSWWGQQIHPNDHARIIRVFNRLNSGDVKKINCSFRVKNKLNEWCEVEVLATVLKRDKKGWAQHIFMLMRDLKFSENNYKRIVENLNEGIWVIDEYNHVQFVNSALASMLGYSVDEMLGQSVFDFLMLKAV